MDSGILLVYFIWGVGTDSERFVSLRVQQGGTDYTKQVWFDMVSPVKDSEWWLGKFLSGVISPP